MCHLRINPGWLYMCFIYCIWNCRNDLTFQKTEISNLLHGYPHSYALDPYVVFTSACGGRNVSGHWVQPHNTLSVQPIGIMV